MIIAEKSNRKDYLDLAKGVLIILLYVYHAETYYNGCHTWSYLFQPFFLAAFFIISGYLAFNDIKHISWSKTINQVIRTLVLPYFIFTLSFLLFKSIFISEKELWDGVYNIFLLRASWFVIALSVLKLVYCGILNRTTNLCFVSIITILLWIVGYVFVLYYRHPDAPYISSVFMNSQSIPNRMPLCLNITLITTPFFFVGLLWRHFSGVVNLDRSWGYITCVCMIYLTVVALDKQFVGSYVIMAIHAYHNILLIMIYAFLGSYSLLLLCYKVKRFPIINHIGINSLIFYFLNGSVLQATTLCFRKITLLTNVNGGVCDSHNYCNCIHLYNPAILGNHK